MHQLPVAFADQRADRCEDCLCQTEAVQSAGQLFVGFGHFADAAPQRFEQLGAFANRQAWSQLDHARPIARVQRAHGVGVMMFQVIPQQHHVVAADPSCWGRCRLLFKALQQCINLCIGDLAVQTLMVEVLEPGVGQDNRDLDLPKQAQLHRELRVLTWRSTACEARDQTGGFFAATDRVYMFDEVQLLRTEFGQQLTFFVRSEG